jgi:subtilisin family serine protease
VRLASLIFLLVVSLTGAGPAARAQLPQVQVPKVPVPGVPALPEVTRAVAGNLRDLAGARALRAERLLREHRAELDRDPRGDLVVRAEVIAIDITQAALDKALAAKFSVLRTEELAGLGVKLTILQTPEGMSASRGLKRLRKLDPEGSYDFNHVYLDSGEVDPGQASLGSVDPRPNAGDGTNGRVGLIDGGVDGAHQTFSRLQVQRHGCDGTIVPSAHGTAVASILVARGNIAEVFAADVYCGQPTGGAVDAVAAAFGWLARERVAVINVSLVGPRNALLERVVTTLVARGHVIVAAVGNDGPAAPPLYPAAYEGVVGVTGVDARHRVLIEACRGKHVDFAALGAQVSAAAQAPDQFSAVRGTSFAAPAVAALMVELREPDAMRRAQLLAKLDGIAQDLGKPGRDDIYGAGELGSAYK